MNYCFLLVVVWSAFLLFIIVCLVSHKRGWTTFDGFFSMFFYWSGAIPGLSLISSFLIKSYLLYHSFIKTYSSQQYSSCRQQLFIYLMKIPCKYYESALWTLKKLETKFEMLKTVGCLNKVNIPLNKKRNKIPRQLIVLIAYIYK